MRSQHTYLHTLVRCKARYKEHWQQPTEDQANRLGHDIAILKADVETLKASVVRIEKMLQTTIENTPSDS